MFFKILCEDNSDRYVLFAVSRIQGADSIARTIFGSKRHFFVSN